MLIQGASMTSRMIRIRISMLSAFIIAVTWFPALAVVLDKVAGDFKPLSGYVVMVKDSEYIIDLDAKKGIFTGDLFSVLQPGEKIVHPVSGEILGTLEELKGILKVTRLQEGYSYARPFGKIEGIKQGDPIRRYENIPALFWDYSGSGEPFFLQLRNTLPHLKWQDYAAAQAAKPNIPAASKIDSPTLIFILKKEGLEVRDSEFQIIHTYGSLGLLPVAVEPTPKAATSIEEGVGYQATYPGFQAVADLAGATVMADFIQDGDRLLMATTDGSAIRVYVVGKNVSLLTKRAPEGDGQILSVQWWQPSDEVSLHLAVTYLNDQKVEAKIFDLRENGLVPLRAWLPYFLGTFDLVGDGTPETLLRQSFDQDLFWGGQIKKISLIQGKLKASNPGLKVPGSYTVLGSLFADLTGDGHLESVFVRGKELYIYAGKKQLYRSPPNIGGSLSVATYEVDPDAKNLFLNSAVVEVSPTVADLDGDGRLELVVIASDRPSIGAPGISPGIKNTRLAVVKYRDGTFVKGTLGEMLGKPVQGLTVAHGRLLFVTTETSSFFSKGGNSHLLAYPLVR
jgi:hypothetical protein